MVNNPPKKKKEKKKPKFHNGTAIIGTRGEKMYKAFY